VLPIMRRQGGRPHRQHVVDGANHVTGAVLDVNGGQATM
jgi:hypothetical protein